MKQKSKQKTLSKKGEFKTIHSAKNKKVNYWLYLALVIVLMITYISFGTGIKNEFTNWDDPTYVVDNDIIKNISKQNIDLMFTKPVSLNYHPLTMLSLAINYHFSKLDPKPYHVTNLIFHLLNTILVFIFIYLLTNRNLIIPFIVSALFGVHPMHVESVAWISERKDVLYTFFYFLSLIFYLKYLESKRIWFIAFAFILFTFSLLSKAVAVTLPVVFLLIDLYQKRKINLSMFLEKLPFFIASIVFGIAAIRIQSEGAIAKEGVLSLFERIMFSSYGFWLYIVKLVVPFKLSTFYPYPRLSDSGNLPLIFYLSPVIVLAIASIAFFTRKISKVIWFGLLFYLITIALVLQFLPVGKAIIADRYTYIPYIGIFFIIAYGYNYLLKKENLNNIIKYSVSGVLVIYIIAMSYYAYEQTQVWKNSGTLWTQVINNYPDSEVAYKNRGNFYGDLRQTAKAMNDYNVLLANNQADGQIWGNIGNIHRMNEKYDEAYKAYNKAVVMDDKNPTAYINRGIINSILKKYSDALSDFDKAIQFGASQLKVIGNRAYTYLYYAEETNKPEDYDKAISDFTVLINSNPTDYNLFLSRGLGKFKQNRFEDALKDFNQSIQIKQDYAGSYFNVSVCYYKMNQYKKALEYANKAQSLGYKVGESYINELKSK